MSVIRSEGFEPKTEILASGDRYLEKKHPFSEIRIVARGEVVLSISGNQILLRAGDRVEIPANTKHFFIPQSPEVETYFAHKPY